MKKSQLYWQEYHRAQYKKRKAHDPYYKLRSKEPERDFVQEEQLRVYAAQTRKVQYEEFFSTHRQC